MVVLLLKGRRRARHRRREGDALNTIYVGGGVIRRGVGVGCVRGRATAVR